MANCNDPQKGALLHSYELQILKEDEAEEFEKHLLACEDCFRKVQEFTAFARTMKESPAIRKLAAEHSDEIRALPFHRRLWQSLWPDVPVWLRPGLIYLLVIILAIPAFHGLRRLTAGGDDARAANEIRLVNTRSVQDNTFEVDQNNDRVINFLFSRVDRDKRYRVLIANAEGREVIRFEDFQDFNNQEMGCIVVSSARMPQGLFRLSIVDPGGDSLTPFVEYPFRLIPRNR